MEKKSNNNKNAGFNRVDVFGLFNALYANGRAKLSDHFVNDDPGNEKTENKTDK